MSTFTSYEDVVLGDHIVRTEGKRKGWSLMRVVPDGSYPGPHFFCEKTDEVFEDWDLPDDKCWEVLS